MARERRGDCIDSRTTLDEVMCLLREIETTKGNLTEYSTAFHDIFGLAAPDEAAWQFSGATGRPLTATEIARAFDEVEGAWQTYRSALCSTAYGLDKGGTIAPVSAASCELRVMRSHMRELGAILGEGFHRWPVRDSASHND